MKSLPIHEVRAIGWKLDGSSGASLAAALGINLMTSRFQLLGTSPHCQHVEEIHKSSGQERAVFKNQIWNLVEWTGGGLSSRFLYHPMDLIQGDRTIIEGDLRKESTRQPGRLLEHSRLTAIC